MSGPVIGITTYHREGDERPRFTLPTAYVDAVRAAGGVPVLLPPGEGQPADALAPLDGLLLGGGGDIDPARFGGSAGHPSQYFTSEERDGFELALVVGALARELPILAICRGMQILNVALGGSLHVHLPDVLGEAVPHRISQDRHTFHPVELGADSRLEAVLGTAAVDVASWHHQGVSRAGEGLEVVARAPDGAVEALELAGRPEVAAVQWHPELQQEPGSPHRLLFADLVAYSR